MMLYGMTMFYNSNDWASNANVIFTIIVFVAVLIGPAVNHLVEWWEWRRDEKAILEEEERQDRRWRAWGGNL